jgi:hypothetical protein
MSVAGLPLTFLALASVTSSCVPNLPAFAGAPLLQRLHAQKIVKIHELRERTIDDVDYLGLFATFEIT